MCKRPLCAIALLFVVSGATQAGIQKWESVVGGANPIHWYRFDEAPGTTVADDEGSVDLDGEYRSLVELGQDGVFGPGQAVRFERGGQDDVMWTQGGDVTSGEWTAEFVIMKMSNTVAQALSDSADFSLRVVGWGVDEELSFTEYGVIDARFTAVGGADLVAPVEQWIHVVYRKSGSETQVFVDGVLTGTTSTLIDCPIDSFGGRTGSASDGMDGFMDEAVIYDYALTDDEIAVHAAAPFLPDVGAIILQPEDGATDVPRDTVLSWMAGTYAATHDVYLGTVFEDVNAATRDNPLDVLVSQGQTDTAYDPAGSLQLGQTYYWRIDEVNAAPDSTIFKGDIWSFTVEPVGYPIEGIIATSNGVSEAGVGPENTVNGSGLNENDEHSTASETMWLATPNGVDPIVVTYEFDRVYKLHEMLVWNYNVEFELLLGFGIKDVAVEVSDNGIDWISLGDAELAQATAQGDYTANTAVDLGGVAAQYVRLTVNSGFGMMGQFGLSEVRFLYIPAHPREPQPADGATEVSVDAMLAWRAGRDAAVHEVYLGTDREALALADSVSDTSYVPGDLEFGSTYYWKINEVNEAEAVASWEGDVWSFATLEYAVIDDMESYDDEENRIYDTWLDGFVNDTGATVGYFDAPFAEQTIVNSGGQSMPLEYDNSASPFYSEAEFDLGSANWNTNGADTLAVNFRGNGPEFLETADGHIIMNSIGADVWGTADEFRYAYKRLSGNGSIIARVESVVNSWPWAKAGVMIREGLDAGSTHATAAVTPGNGVAVQWRPVMNQASFNVNEAGLEAPYWVKLTRTGSTFTAERSEDGVTWVSITADAAASTVEIEMGSDVYIGLMSVSTRANIVGGAEFSNITTTGNVTGAWETQGIGVEQPAGNDPEALYVAVEDSTGNVAVMTHPDPLAVLSMDWQEWKIPFSELGGVNLGRVAIMTIGVGNRDNPSAGGSGLIFIDDVGYGRPASVE